MRLYHGSIIIVDKPTIIKPNRPLDFGQGFYLTSLQDQAERWAIAKSKIFKKTGIVSVYNLEINEVIKNYKVKQFEYANDEWLDLVEVCRRNKNHITGYDVVIGEVADDKVYDTINLYLDGILPRELALQRIKYKYKNDQMCITNADILKKYLIFESSYEVRR